MTKHATDGMSTSHKRNRLVLTLLFVAVIAIMGLLMQQGDITGFSTYDDVTGYTLWVNETYESQAEPYVLALDNDFPFLSVVISGKMRGEGGVTVIATDGIHNWTVYAGVLDKKSAQITGLVIGDSLENMIEENVSEVDTNVSISDTIENITVEEIVFEENVSVNVSLNETNITLNDSLLVENDSLNITVNETLNITINESLNISVNVSNISIESNVSLNETVNSTFNLTNETNITLNDSLLVENDSLNITVNDSLNVSFNDSVNISINETLNFTLNETENVTSNESFIIEKSISSFCLDSCQLPEISDLELLILVDGNTSFTLENVEYTVKEVFVQEVTVPNITTIINKSLIIDVRDYFPTLKDEFIDVPSVDGLSAVAEGYFVIINPLLVGEYEFFFYISDGDSLLKSNMFTITVIEEANVSLLTNVTTNTSFTNITGLVQAPAVVGEPVLWHYVIPAEENTTTEVNLTGYAENVTVKALKEDKQVKEVVDISVLDEKEISKLDKWLAKDKKKDKKKDKFIVLELNETNATDYLVNYETPAPVQTEENISSSSKVVTISSDVHYVNVTTTTVLPLPVPQRAITLMWENYNLTIPPENITYNDANNDGLIESITWTIPHLSNQTFTIDVTVLNPIEYLRDGDVWAVRFETIGMANLTINSTNAYFMEVPTDDNSTIDEMEFLNFTCDGVDLFDQLLINDENASNFSGKPTDFLIPDYECNGTGQFVTKVHIAGYAILQFTFANFNETVTDYAIDPDPVIVDVEVTPSGSETDDTLTCNVSLTDAESSSLTAYYEWFKDGTSHSSGSFAVSNNSWATTTISSSSTALGEVWTCQITPNDGTNNGTPENTSTLIRQAVSIDNAIITWENGTWYPQWAKRQGGTISVQGLITTDTRYDVTEWGNAEITIDPKGEGNVMFWSSPDSVAYVYDYNGTSWTDGDSFGTGDNSVGKSVDRYGKYVMAVSSTSSSSEAPYYRLSKDGGDTWEAAATEIETGTYTSEADDAGLEFRYLSDGTGLLIFGNSSMLGYWFYAYWNGTGWESTGEITAARSIYDANKIGIGALPDGKAYIVYGNGSGGGSTQMYAQYWNGSGFESATSIGSGYVRRGGVAVSCNYNSRCIATFRGPTDYQLHYSRYNGSAWSTAADVDGASSWANTGTTENNYTSSDVKIDDDDKAIVVWYNGTKAVKYATYDWTSNTWTEGTDTIGDAYAAAFDGDGPRIALSSSPTLDNIVLNSSSGKNTSSENLTLYFDETGSTSVTSVDWRVNDTSMALINMPFNKNITSTTNGAVIDYSSFENNGTLGGGNSNYVPTWTSSGKVGGAYSFDGVDDYISLPSIELYNRSFSVSAWVKPYATTNADGNLFFGDRVSATTQGAVHCVIYNTGSLRFGFYSNDLNTPTGNIAFESWNYVVMTYNYSSDTSKIYVNGSELASGSQGPLLLDSPTTTIGSFWTHYFNGSIDEFMLFNFTLSPEQINASFDAGAANHSLKIIVSDETTVGDNWTAVLTPTDGATEGTSETSNNVYVRDGFLVSDVSFSPTAPNSSENVYGLCTGLSVDGSKMGFVYDWYKNGVLYSSGMSGLTTTNTSTWNTSWSTSSTDGNDKPFDAAVDSNGHLYVVGRKNQNTGQIHRYESNGTINDTHWNKTFTGYLPYHFNAVAVDSNDDVYVTGYRKSSGSDDIDVVIKKFWGVNGSEDTNNWNKVIDFSGLTEIDKGTDIAIDSQDNIYVVGYSNGTSGNSYDWWIKRYDTNGTENTTHWNLTVDGGSVDFARSVAVDDNDDVYVSGSGWDVNGGGANDDAWMKKFWGVNGSEDTSWNITYGGTGSAGEIFYVEYVDRHGNVYVGTKDWGPGWEAILKRYDSSGTEDTDWNIHLNDWNSEYDYWGGMAVDEAGNVFVGFSVENTTGTAISPSHSQDWVTKKFYYNGTEDATWNFSYDEAGYNDQVVAVVLFEDLLYLVGFVNETANDVNADWYVKQYNLTYTGSYDSGEQANVSLLGSTATSTNDVWTLSCGAVIEGNLSDWLNDTVSISGSSPVSFTDITTGSGLVTGGGGGLSFFDCNNDGYLDVIMNEDLTANDVIKLFQNDAGDGTFTDYSTALDDGNGTVKYRGLSTGDKDNDGWPDVIVRGQSTSDFHLMWTNAKTGNCSFNSGRWSNTYHDVNNVVFVDVNGDSYLDIYAVASDIDYAENDGDGTFTARTGVLGLAHDEYSGGSTAADWTNDGYIDLLAMNGSSSGDDAYENDGDYTYTENDATGFPSDFDSYADTVMAWGDCDNDGALDFYLASRSTTANGGADDDDGTSGLYLNDGSGSFTAATTFNSGDVDYPDGADWGDVDNDGDLDLLIVESSGTSQLWENNGDCSFTDITSDVGLAGSAAIGVTAGFFDIDNDGDLDIISNDPVKLWENNLDGDNYLRVVVRGSGNTSTKNYSNYDCIGCQINLYNSTGGLVGHREISGGYNKLQPPKWQHFGVNADNTYTVEVHFTTQETKNYTIVPNEQTTIIGSTTLQQTFEVIESDFLPSVSGVILNSTDGTNYTTENLTVYYSTFDQDDDDTVTAVTDWRLNGTSIALINMPFDKNITLTTSGGVKDYSTNARNGTLGGGNSTEVPNWISSGRIGGAFNFSAVNDTIDLVSNITLTGPFTLSLWVNKWFYGATTSNHNGIIGDAISYTNGRITFLSNTQIALTINGTVGETVGSTMTFPKNEWYHLTIRRDDSDALSIFVNATDVTSGTHSRSGSITVGRIGDNPDDSTFKSFGGAMDELLLFNKSLSDEQIEALYDAGAANHSLKLIVSNETANFDNWTVVVTPIDGFENGTVVTSNYVYVAPDSQHPIITFISPTPSDGDSISVSYAVLNTTITDASKTSAWFDFDGSLLGYWSMDYYNSTRVFDNSTQELNGTFSGSGFDDGDIAAGVFGDALHFDGVSDRVNVVTNSKVNDSVHDKNISVSVWFKTDDTSDEDQTIFTFYEPSLGDSHYFRRRAAGDFRLYQVINGTSDGWSTSSSYVTDTNWHHLVWLIHGTNNSFYLDGDLKESHNMADSLNNISGTPDIDIGGHPSFSAFTFNGTLDEVMLFDRLLTEEEVLALYNNTANRLHANFSDLSNGTHNYSVYAIDTEGNLNITSSRNVTIDPPFVVTDCENITVSGNYALQNDIRGPGICLNVSADDVSIDCAGHELNYTTSLYGVSVSGYDNLTVKNCVINSEIDDSENYGIYVYDSLNANITNTTITVLGLSSYAVYLRSQSDDAVITGNTFNSDYYRGLLLEIYDSENATLRDNIFNSSSSTSIIVRSGHDQGDADFVHDIDRSNLAPTLPVCVNQSLSDTVISDVDLTNTCGSFICLNCDNVTYDAVNFSGDGLSVFGSRNITLTNINSTTSDGDALNTWNVIDLTVEDSTFVMTGAFSADFDFTDDLVVRNSTFSAGASSALVLANSDTALFEDVAVPDGDIRFYYAYDVVIKDSNFSTPSNFVTNCDFNYVNISDTYIATSNILFGFDYCATADGNITLTNVTGPYVDDLSVGTTTQVYFDEYVDVNVTDNNSVMLSGVSVAADDVTGDTFVTNVTDGVSLTRMVVRTGLRNSTHNISYNNYTFNASLAYYDNNWSTVNVTNSSVYTGGSPVLIELFAATDGYPYIFVENTFVNSSSAHEFNVTAGVNNSMLGTVVTSVSINSVIGTCVNVANNSIGAYFNTTYSCNGTPYQRDTINITFCTATNKCNTSISSNNSYPNQAPSVPTLLNPANNNFSIRTRNVFLNWTASTDADGDSFNYTLNITNSFAPDYYRDNITINNHTTQEELWTEYETQSNLYNWSVKACDQWNCSSYTGLWNFSIDDYLSVEIINDSIDFGSDITPGVTNDTTNDAPYPFVFRNDGIILANLSNVSSTGLWQSVALNTAYFRFMADNTTESNSFDWANSLTSWTNVQSSYLNTVIANLNYSNAADEAAVEIAIEVPAAEVPGTKTSTMTFTWEAAQE